MEVTVQKATEQIKGRGLIHVSSKPSFLADLGNPYTLEEWQKALLLPDEYTVIGIFYDTRGIELLVESTLIPVEPDQNKPIEVTPYYSKVDEKAVLTRIEIKQWGGAGWVEVIPLA